MTGLVNAVIATALTFPAGTTVAPNPYDPGTVGVSKRKVVDPGRASTRPPHVRPVTDPPASSRARSEPVENLCDFDHQEQAVCAPPDAPTIEPPDLSITPGDVERAVKRVGLPRLTTQIQPAGTTLVNLDTIFHTTADPFERTVQVLDSTVELRATPAAYTWHHGDGTTQTTNSPGRPYPAMEITHRYDQPGRTHASVDVTYRVTYRIDDGGWEDLDTTITATGPATSLRIREARPVLTR